MNSKDDFKAFVRDNPILVKYVRDGTKTWQDFYEIFNLYGSDNSVWNEYLNNDSSNRSLDFLSWIKSVDIDSIQNGVASIQRVLGVFQEMSEKSSSDHSEKYNPRPLYKHFED